MLLASASSTSSSTPDFLIPNGTIIVEFVLFVIVFGIVSKFVLPPLQRVMRERDERVRAGLSAGEERRDEAEHLSVERQQVLDEARADARSALEGATRTAEKLRSDARERGQAEFDRLLAEAQPGLVAADRQAREDLAGRLQTIVVAAAERVVGIEIDPARHSELFVQAAAELAGQAPGEKVAP